MSAQATAALSKAQVAARARLAAACHMNTGRIRNNLKWLVEEFKKRYRVLFDKELRLGGAPPDSAFSLSPRLSLSAPRSVVCLPGC